MSPATRTDDRAKLIRETLDRCGYSPLRQIDCEVKGKVLTLRGAVPTHFMKQIALASAAKSAGDLRIVNKIRVVDPDCQL